MSKKVTLVSALYDLDRCRWKYSGFPPTYDRYINWVKNLLSIDAPIHMFVDDHYHDHVVNERKKFDPYFAQTTIVKMPLDELYFYKKYYNRESALMASPEFRNKIFQIHSADMNYPLYHIINYSKIQFVKIAATENRYDASHFFWVDAGGFRDDIVKYANKKWPNPDNSAFSDRVTHFTHNLEFTLYPNKDEYFRGQTRNIQGTAWIVSKEKVQPFFEMIDNQVETIIGEKIVGSDEKVYDFLYTSHKDFYNLKQGGWFSFYDICAFPPRNIFVDMGGHQHQGLNKFKSILNIDETWEVHSFEPNPAIAASNYQRVSGINVVEHRKAVWLFDGRVKFNQYGHRGESQGSLVVDTGAGTSYPDYTATVDVDCIDAHKFISSLDPLANIYMKVDIEHSEYPVLEKMLNAGWPRNIKEIWVEWHGRSDEEVSKATELTKRITNAGTKVHYWE